MKTKTIKLYTFDELSEEAKKKALEKLYDINVYDDYWYDDMLEEFKEDMKKMGYYVENVYFRGFWSQGDGACFTGSVDILEYVKIKKLGNKYRKLLHYVKDMGGSVDITTSGRYYHPETMRFEDNIIQMGSLYDDEILQQATIIVDLIEKEAREKVDELYERLEEQYDYLVSEEAIIDTIECNDYYFTKDGELEN